MFHQKITFLSCFVSFARTFVIKTPGLFNKQIFQVESDICCCWFFSPSHPFSKHVIPPFFLFPFKWHCCWNTDICAVRGALCLSHSLSLGVRLRGLVCAWVPRIMITAAEKHISGDKGRQSASRGLNRLPVAYCGANRKVTTNNQATPYQMHMQDEYPQLSFPPREKSVSLKWYWNYIHTVFQLWGALAYNVPLHYCPISYCGGSFPTKRSNLGSFPTERPNLIFQFKDSLM